jgi:hypothetical protein
MRLLLIETYNATGVYVLQPSDILCCGDKWNLTETDLPGHFYAAKERNGNTVPLY